MKVSWLPWLAWALTLCTSCGGGGDVAQDQIVSVPGLVPAAPAPDAIADRGTPNTVPPQTCELGDPIPGLTISELDAFDRGKIVFEKRFKPSEGLGAFYNATSCASCHSTPVSGGAAELYRNFYMAVSGPPGAQFPLSQLVSPIVPSYGSGPHMLFANFTLEGGRVSIPDQPDVTVAQRGSIPIFGTGLFEFISNGTILANADPDDLINPDGISGRYNSDFGAVGRLGQKAQANNIEIFTRAPLFNQMGITSDPLLGSGGIVSARAAAQGTFDPDVPTTDADGVADPEISLGDLSDLIAYTRFLAPPARRQMDGYAAYGEVLFEQVGCVKCHIPTLASSRGPVNAYTDLLIHDMGTDLADGISLGFPQFSNISPPTTDQEWRTPPLWGISLSGPYMHDGRAATLEEAIVMHAGEADAVQNAYLALPKDQQARLIAFLEHL
jgi:CxxC motif-containing protein (DUF1111 family)